MTNSHPARAGIVAAALAGTLVLTQATAPAAPLAAPDLASVPLVIAPWKGAAAPPLAADVAEVLAADQYLRRYYRGPRGVIEMDVAYYSQPRVGATMHSPLNCLPGNGWEVTHVSTRTIAGAGEWPVRELTVERGRTRYALTYWFHGRQRVLADEVSARFYALADAVRRRPADAGLVRLMTPVAGSGDNERAMLASFAERLIPELQTRLR
jgi:EpsI family protein